MKLPFITVKKPSGSLQTAELWSRITLGSGLTDDVHIHERFGVIPKHAELRAGTTSMAGSLASPTITVVAQKEIWIGHERESSEPALGAHELAPGQRIFIGDATIELSIEEFLQSPAVSTRTTAAAQSSATALSDALEPLPQSGIARLVACSDDATNLRADHRIVTVSTMIGRANCDVTLSHESVPLRAARLLIQESGNWRLIPRATAGPIEVNGVSIASSVGFAAPAWIRIGVQDLLLVIEPGLGRDGRPGRDATGLICLAVLCAAGSVSSQSAERVVRLHLERSQSIARELGQVGALAPRDWVAASSFLVDPRRLVGLGGDPAVTRLVQRIVSTLKLGG